MSHGSRRMLWLGHPAGQRVLGASWGEGCLILLLMALLQGHLWAAVKLEEGFRDLLPHNVPRHSSLRALVASAQAEVRLPEWQGMGKPRCRDYLPLGAILVTGSDRHSCNNSRTGEGMPVTLLLPRWLLEQSKTGPLPLLWGSPQDVWPGGGYGVVCDFS